MSRLEIKEWLSGNVNNLQLFVSKPLPSELNLSLSWDEIEVNRNEEVLLELTWTPTVAEACRHTFTLSDGRRINRDIAVILKSVNPKVSNNASLVEQFLLTTCLIHLQGANTGKIKSKKPATLPLVRRPSPPKRLKPQKKSPFKVSVTPSKNQNFSPPARPNIPHIKSSVWQDENKENHVSSFTISDQMRETFNLGRETYVVPPNPLQFHDSLESPSITPLKELKRSNSNTPTLESLLNNHTRLVDKLNSPRKLNLSPSPNSCNSSIFSLTGFVPSLTSTISKPPSTNNSYEKSSYLAEFNNSKDTYIKNNVSSETYVKDFSGETFVKGDLSAKDDIPLTQTLEVGCVSPCFNRTGRVSSPVGNFRSPQMSPKFLSIIAEETGIFSETSLRPGAKRKICTSTDQPAVKREKTDHSSIKDWSKTGGSAVRIAKTTTGLKLRQHTTSPDHLATITETYTTTVIVKNPFLYANIIDPFMTSSVYRSEEWLDEQEKNFTKWLNALLTPPAELSAKNEVDVAKIWQVCTKKEVPLAPTKETVSFCYHTNNKLDKLRQAARQLFYSKDMSTVLQKVCTAVDSGKLSIREDKNVHLNLKLKSEIVALILGYNPLWLRLGLETIYNEIIPLKSNSDSHGLTDFLLQRFLCDPYLLRKHKSVVSPKYSADLKKFLLKKLLMLVYFLDRAKNVKLIPHDPCLFCKNATDKDSKSVLAHFARETLSAVGDINKYLKSHGYVVTHLQSYIHEFDYGVNNLGGDLRDGVRLTRVMEIIQMRDDLTSKLRVPAISRLQKVHNNQIVFNSLLESGYEIQFEITPKDLVDGHREKTLSFLWQIIYKFEAPLMSKSATTIQKWFRSLPVMLKRRKFEKIRRNQVEAALKIQHWYFRLKKASYYNTLSELIRNFVEERRRQKAALKLQAFFKTIVCRKRYLRLHSITIQLQAYSKGWLIRHNYTLRNTSAIIIQRQFRTFMCRKRFLELKHSVITVQRRYRARKEGQIALRSYQTIKNSTITIQRRFRALLTMRECRAHYIKIRLATIKCQSYFRMYRVRQDYVTYRNAVVTVQQRFRALLAMKHQVKEYQNLRQTVINVQTRFRAKLITRELRREYVAKRQSAITIQRRFRACNLMKVERMAYQELRGRVVVIQRRFRANALMKIHKNRFDSLKNAAITVQRRFRARQAMKQQRQLYTQLKWATSVIQRAFRARKVLQTCRQHFVQYKNATVTIQRRFRATLLARKERAEFLEKRQIVTKIQTRYRALQLMKPQRTYFLEVRRSVVVIQTWYRATKLMKIQNQHYNSTKQAAVTVQRRFRAQQAMKLQLQHYNKCRNAAVSIQRWFRAGKAMRICRSEFLQLRNATIIIQRRYRAVLAGKKVRTEFQEMRQTVIQIQTRFRALRAMKVQRKQYLELRQSVSVIQVRFRATMLMRKQRGEFEALRFATLKIQRFYQSYREMKKQRTVFLLTRGCVLRLQPLIRGYVVRKKYSALLTPEAIQERKLLKIQNAAATKIQVSLS